MSKVHSIFKPGAARSYRGHGAIRGADSRASFLLDDRTAPSNALVLGAGLQANAPVKTAGSEASPSTIQGQPTPLLEAIDA